MIAFGGFIIGWPLYGLIVILFDYESPNLFGVCVAIATGYMAIKVTSPGTWNLPTKNENGKEFIIETQNRIPLLQEEVKIYEASDYDHKETCKVINISVNNNMIYITLGYAGRHQDETYKISRFDISS